MSLQNDPKELSFLLRDCCELSSDWDRKETVGDPAVCFCYCCFASRKEMVPEVNPGRLGDRVSVMLVWSRRATDKPGPSESPFHVAQIQMQNGEEECGVL